MGKKKLLLVGSAGFKLSNFVRYLIRKDKSYEISSIDFLQEETAIYNNYINTNHKFHIADAKDAHIMKMIFKVEEPDIVIFGASSFDSKDKYLDIVNIQNECEKHNSKLIYLSADSVYIPQQLETDPLLTEESEINSSSMALPHILYEQRIKNNATIIRISSVYGQRQNKFQFVPKTIYNILKEKPIVCFNVMRDWLYIEDFCEALYMIMEHGKENEIYNVGAGLELPQIEMAQKICNILGKGHELLQADVNYSFTRWGTNFDKLKSLGWERKFKLNDGLEKTIHWYLNNNWFLDK